MNGSCEVTSALSMTSRSGTTVPSAATTNADGSTRDAAACDAGEKSAIEYGLNPAIRPAVPSNPITTVPAAGGELGTDAGPVGAIGSGSPGGVHAVTASVSATTAGRRRRGATVAADRPTPRRCDPGASTASPYGTAAPGGGDRLPDPPRRPLGQLAGTLFRDRVFARSVAVSATLRIRAPFGVTSTHSSSAQNSSACSRDSDRGGTRWTSSSPLDCRMLVSFFSLVMFTSMSSEREFSPMIMPS